MYIWSKEHDKRKYKTKLNISEEFSQRREGWYATGEGSLPVSGWEIEKKSLNRMKGQVLGIGFK